MDRNAEKLNSRRPDVVSLAGIRPSIQFETYWPQFAEPVVVASTTREAIDAMMRGWN